MKNILNFLVFFVLAAVFAPVFAQDLEQNKTKLTRQIKPSLSVVNNEIFIISLFDRGINKNILNPQNEEEQKKIDELYNADNANRTLGNVILVKNPNFNLLINTGDRSTFSKLKMELEKRDIKPADITHIALSNAHSSNIGGLGEIYKNFKNAILLINQDELEYWQKEGDELTKKRLEFYKGKINFLVTDTEIIKNSSIKAIVLGGHTPGTTIFSFNDEFYDLGDLIYSFDVQLRFSNMGDKFDIYPTKAIEVRQKIIEFLKENKKKFIGFYAPESDALSYSEWLELL